MPADSASPRNANTAPLGDTMPVSDEIDATLTNTRQSLNHMTGECLAINSDSLASAMASSSEVARLASEFGKSYMDVCGLAMGNFTAVSRQAMTCRTPEDLFRLQRKTFEGVGSTMEAVNKMYAGLFHAYSKALEPVISRVADGPERLFRAVAD